MYSELKEFGLSENEIEVYIFLLKAGSSNANKVAKVIGMKRTTAYDTLNFLMNKGVVSTLKRGRVQYFNAADPQKIVDLINEKRDKIIKILPNLKSLKGEITENTGVNFFEGRRGITTLLNDILDEAKEFLCYGSKKQISLAIKHYPEDFARKRAKKGIKLKAVFAEEDRGTPVYKESKVNRTSKIRYLKLLNQISANVVIYNDKVGFITSKEHPIGLIIQGKEIVDQQKKIFELLWKTAKD